ncbi:OmpA family protein [Belliella sp. DSM 107340]|uniref:OmpA family protein n=1 Tax=Belliella calami TaxID=2923436 RepID=A0ABS9UU53_9BACT|nr:OmpA family protein [Belliella calami]MCH7400162.1 OmpA family protein [Belliella calami]
MKKSSTILLVFLFTVAVSNFGLAQRSLLRFADQQSELAKHNYAAQVYVQAFEKKQSYRAAKGAAMSFDKLKNYEKSFIWWQNTLSQSIEGGINDVEFFLIAAHSIERHEEAFNFLNEIGFETSDIDMERYEMILASFEENSRLDFENFHGVNSMTAADFSGSKDKVGNFYFVSDRERVAQSKSVPLIRLDARNRLYDKDIHDWTGREYLRIYRYDTLGHVSEMDFGRDDFMHISDPAVANIGGEEYLFFSATRNIRKVKRRKEHTVFPELFFGKLRDGQVDEILEFSFNNSLVYSIITPFYDSTTSKLYFASDMEGGFGAFDLYSVDVFGDDELEFSSPHNLGINVNSEGNEKDPFIYQDILYFSSDGHLGFGGMDIFQVKIKGENIYADREHMGTPYNTVKDDFAYRVFDEREIYLSSNRMGDSGLDDIYKQSEFLRRFMVTVIDCDGDIVKDSNLNVAFGESSTLELQLGEDGVYKANLQADTDYFLSLSKHGHFSVLDSSITTKNNELNDIEKQYRLIKFPVSEAVYSDILFFNLDKSEIRVDANQRLDKIASMMEKYDFLNLKIASHTDSRATETYNLTLSQKRSESVLEGLIQKGINPDRVSLDWHGEQKLLTDCPDGVNCPEELHQLNRRSELSLSVSFEEGSLIPLDMFDIDWCNDSDLISLWKESFEVPIVYFDFDKYDIRLTHKMELERLVLLMNNNENINLILEGHTDIRGSEAYNKVLSEKRAKIVMDYLKDRGINEARLQFNWFGKSQPIHDCLGEPCSPALHQLNRRTEIKIK